MYELYIFHTTTTITLPSYNIFLNIFVHRFYTQAVYDVQALVNR